MWRGSFSQCRRSLNFWALSAEIQENRGLFVLNVPQVYNYTSSSLLASQDFIIDSEQCIYVKDDYVNQINGPRQKRLYFRKNDCNLC